MRKYHGEAQCYHSSVLRLCGFLRHRPSIIVEVHHSSLLFALPLIEQMPAAPLVTTLQKSNGNIVVRTTVADKLGGMTAVEHRQRLSKDHSGQNSGEEYNNQPMKRQQRAALETAKNRQWRRRMSLDGGG